MAAALLSAPGRALAESWTLGETVNPAKIAHGAGRLATVAGEKAITVWDTTRRAHQTDPLTFDQRVLSAWLSPDGKWLAAVLADNSVLICDAATGRRIGSPLPHDGAIHSVIFSPDPSTYSSEECVLEAALG